ncbi:MAG: PAS domain S-box protein [Ignavibacteriota bacterium]
MRLIGANVDITERKQIEEALRESQTRLEAALASMTDAVSISDTRGVFTHYNDAFATFYRFGTKAECARTFAEYPDVLSAFFADGSPAPTEMWAVPRALRGERSNNAEYILSRKDTGETWVGSYSFGPILDESGAISGSVVVARDITDRKREQERLRASEQRFRQIFENAPTGIAIAGWGRAAGTMQSAFCELLGYTAEELHGVWFASLIPDGDREVAIADVGRLRAGDVPFFQCESRYPPKTGRTGLGTQAGFRNAPRIRPG